MARDAYDEKLFPSPVTTSNRIKLRRENGVMTIASFAL